MQHIGKLIQIKNNAGSLDELIELLTLRRIGHIGDVFRKWNWLNVARAASGRAVHKDNAQSVLWAIWRMLVLFGEMINLD